MPAGYSGTPLPKKLGIKEGHRIVLVGAPKGYDKTLGKLPADVEVRETLRGGPFDVIHFFTKKKSDLLKRFPQLAGKLEQNGGLWISWPKKASKVATDVTEADVRRIGLESGLVDNKICAVDETWSGLRFVIRVKDRRK
ncbi:MAG: DUF3052 family protein [Candidatus Eisenbacteria bacterium]|uniref:DUF3052 family protein n=1 Tax=Eiseniibacteriota bacterium TaxID=2212470 RepID=A0A7Y2E6P8_UNCEI|nr:DUF3052 family protein [Candidatus Eisenbacteria bacterium]